VASNRQHYQACYATYSFHIAEMELKHKSCLAFSMLLIIAGIEVRKTGVRGEHNFPFFPNEPLEGYGLLKKFVPRCFFSWCIKQKKQPLCRAA
jgi:hypothetical protein